MPPFIFFELESGDTVHLTQSIVCIPFNLQSINLPSRESFLNEKLWLALRKTLWRTLILHSLIDCEFYHEYNRLLKPFTWSWNVLDGWARLRNCESFLQCFDYLKNASKLSQYFTNTGIYSHPTVLKCSHYMCVHSLHDTKHWCHLSLGVRSYF